MKNRRRFIYSAFYDGIFLQIRFLYEDIRRSRNATVTVALRWWVEYSIFDGMLWCTTHVFLLGDLFTRCNRSIFSTSAKWVENWETLSTKKTLNWTVRSTFLILRMQYRWIAYFTGFWAHTHNSYSAKIESFLFWAIGNICICENLAVFPIKTDFLTN